VLLQGDRIWARDVPRAADEHAEGRGIQERTSAAVATYQRSYLEYCSSFVRCHAITQMNHIAVQLMKPEPCCMERSGSVAHDNLCSRVIRRGLPDDQEDLPC
jgi:hypothetical protein